MPESAGDTKTFHMLKLGCLKVIARHDESFNQDSQLGEIFVI